MHLYNRKLVDIILCRRIFIRKKNMKNQGYVGVVESYRNFQQSCLYML